MDDLKRTQNVEALEKELHDLRKSFEKKEKEEADKKFEDEMYARISERINPPTPKRKMVWASAQNDGQKLEEGTEKMFFGQFLKAVIGKSEVDPLIKAALQTGSGSGQYLVPTEYSNEVIRLAADASVLIGKARNLPMGTAGIRKIPRQTGAITMTWTDEVTAKTESNPTFDQLTQTAKKAAAIAKVSDELLMDNNVNIDNLLKELVAESIAEEFDKIGLVGNTGGGDPFMGLAYVSGANAVSPSSSVEYNNVLDVIYAIASKYRPGSVFFTSGTGEKYLMKIKDSQGRYIWNRPMEGGRPASLNGFPLFVTDQIPSNLGTGTDETWLLFGNVSKYFFFSPRGGMEVKASTEAADLTANTSAFFNDETWFRFVQRVSLDVALPAAFSRMQFK